MQVQLDNQAPKKERDPAEAVIVKHSRFWKVYGEIQECFDRCGGTADPLCKAIVGPSGVGKSTIAEYFGDQHPAKEYDWGREIPNLLVRVPTQITPRSLAEAFLTKLGDPYPSRGTLGALSRRIDRALGKGEGSHGIRLVMLNEIQHFIDSKYGVPYESADWLKDRIEESGVPFIVLGLEYGLELLEQNEQLRRLFTETIEIKTFTWDSKIDREDFRGILLCLKEELADSYEFPELQGLDLACRLHYASFGLIGYLMKIIRGAAGLARRAQTRKVSREMLALAYNKYVRGKNTRCPNPLAEETFNPKALPPITLPGETAANRRMSWTETKGKSRSPLRRDRKLLL
jgi:hypothetical protein